MTDSTRRELLVNKSAFNQMRNVVYHLQRVMKSEKLNKSQVIDRYMQMGQNIGKTFAYELKLQGNMSAEYVLELYHLTVNSKAKMERRDNKLIVIQDHCPLCKYHLKDVDVAGCTITVGAIKELLGHCGFKINNAYVSKSKTYGDSVCTHIYEMKN